MSLILRKDLDRKLTIEELDNNQIYLNNKSGIVATFSLPYEEILMTNDYSGVNPSSTPIVLIESPGPGKFINVIYAYQYIKNEIVRFTKGENTYSYLSVHDSRVDQSKRTSLTGAMTSEEVFTNYYAYIAHYTKNNNPTAMDNAPLFFFSDTLYNTISTFTQSDAWTYNEVIRCESSGLTFSLSSYIDYDSVAIPDIIIPNLIPGELITGLSSRTTAYLNTTLNVSWKADLSIFIKYEIVTLF